MKEEKNKHYIFVYGTLLSGEPNNPHFLANSKKMGAAYIKARMFSLGGFPACKASNDHVVTGEVYEVTADELRNVDSLEGEGQFYTRTKVDAYALILRDGRTVPHKIGVETYFIANIDEQGYEEVISGNWKAYTHLLETKPFRRKTA